MDRRRKGERRKFAVSLISEAAPSSGHLLYHAKMIHLVDLLSIYFLLPTFILNSKHLVNTFESEILKIFTIQKTKLDKGLSTRYYIPHNCEQLVKAKNWKKQIYEILKTHI